MNCSPTPFDPTVLDSQRELEILRTLGEHVVTQPNYKALLNKTAEIARRYLRAESLLVPIIDFENKEYYYETAIGRNAELIKGQKFPLQVGMCGWVLSNKKPLLFGQGNPMPFGTHTQWETGKESALLVPLVSRGHIIGGLSALGKAGGGSFTESDLSLITLLANQVSTPVENAKTVQELEKKQLELKDMFDRVNYEKTFSDVTLKAIGDGLIITNPDGIVSRINPVASELLGLHENEAIGKNITALFSIHSVDGKTMPHPVTEALENNSISRLSNYQTARSFRGKEFDIDGSASILRNEKGIQVGSVMVFRDVTENRRLHDSIKYQATHDSLTYLMNRGEFERRLKNTVESAMQSSHEHALAYMDLDQFKIVNDTCGHAAGDELLRKLTFELKRGVRERDTLARIGGDEFGMILEHCAIDHALEVSEKIRKIVQNFRFYWEGKVFKIGISIGLVPITKKSKSALAILGIADHACYAAKEQGRNCIKIYSEDDQEFANSFNQMSMVYEIQSALENDRFVLHAQPIMHLAESSKSAIHAELLIRMKREDGSLVPPNDFIPAAERYGLMGSVDRWVIRKSCRLVANAIKYGKEIQMVSINLSGHSMGDITTADYIINQIRERDLPFDIFCFEVTETATMGNIKNAIKLMNDLKKLGVKFSLDDFGTGLSSFTYIKQLPIDHIKIDGSFVKGIADNKADHAIVYSMTHIADIMHIKTIAEYVESSDILAALKSIKVDMAQGYFIGKPKPFDEYIDQELISNPQHKR